MSAKSFADISMWQCSVEGWTWAKMLCCQLEDNWCCAYDTFKWYYRCENLTDYVTNMMPKSTPICHQPSCLLITDKHSESSSQWLLATHNEKFLWLLLVSLKSYPLHVSHTFCCTCCRRLICTVLLQHIVTLFCTLISIIWSILYTKFISLYVLCAVLCCRVINYWTHFQCG